MPSANPAVVSNPVRSHRRVRSVSHFQQKTTVARLGGAAGSANQLQRALRFAPIAATL